MDNTTAPLPFHRAGANTPPLPSLLAPSLLAGDHAALAESAATVAQTGLRWLHLDIMDGHFVPNLSFGPETLAALRRAERNAVATTSANAPTSASSKKESATPPTSEVQKNGISASRATSAFDGTPTSVPPKKGAAPLFFDTHLMLSEPQRYLKAFAEAGSDLISIHIEPDYDHAAALREIRALGCQCGIVLNPDTPADAVRPHLDAVDLVLVMTVQPGFGGQAFRPAMLEKLKTLDGWRRENGWQWRLEVDGGIGLKEAAACRTAGADTFVAGTAFFKAPDLRHFAKTVEAL